MSSAYRSGVFWYSSERNTYGEVGMREIQSQKKKRPHPKTGPAVSVSNGSHVSVGVIMFTYGKQEHDHRNPVQ